MMCQSEKYLLGLRTKLTHGWNFFITSPEVSHLRLYWPVVSTESYVLTSKHLVSKAIDWDIIEVLFTLANLLTTRKSNYGYRG